MWMDGKRGMVMLSVLMATYNGEKYLREQIGSLIEQTFEHFTLYIQDDCSTDSSYEIIKSYKERYPQKINVCVRSSNSGGSKNNFIEMMAAHKDDYVMLCDQDDIWLPDKIEKTLAKMKEMEQVYGKTTPLLVHTDLCVVDKGLNVISPSFKQAMNANYDRTRLRDQIIQNTLTGCTCMYNRVLSMLIGEKKPEYMVMHDWWLMLVASAFGKIGHIDDRTVLYRQHGKNEIGAKDVRTLRYKVKKLLAYKDIKEAVAETYLQADSFLCYYEDRLSAEQIELLTCYCGILGKNKLGKLHTVFKLRTFKNGIARNIAYLLFI